jgi:hypothetical protein
MRDLNSESDLNALKVPELKEELEARGILDKKLKLKKDLVEALHEYLLTQGTSGAAKAPEPTANGVNAAAQAKAHAAEEVCLVLYKCPRCHEFKYSAHFRYFKADDRLPHGISKTRLR